MADTLLIHFSPYHPEHTTWAIVNAEGELTTKLAHGSLSNASSFAESKNVVILLDSNFVQLHQLSLPTKNKHKITQSVPFALEELLADEIEDLHFVITNNPNNNKTAVACIAKDTLNKTLNHCENASITPNAIIPDALCLATDKDQWAILFHHDDVTIQKQTYTASHGERDHLNILLEHELNQSETDLPKKIIIFQESHLESQDDIESINLETLKDIEIIPVSYNEHPLVIYCGNYKNALPLNLLQNEYRPIKKKSSSFLRWKTAASLALFWLTLYLGNLAYHNHQLESSNSVLRAQIINIYKTSFPNSKRIVNARVQMDQKLQELKSGSSGSDDDLLTLLQNSHKAFSANKSVSIQSINYRNNHADILLTSSNLNAIESINKALNTQHQKSEIISSSSENNTVKGNIRISKRKS